MTRCFSIATCATVACEELTAACAPFACAEFAPACFVIVAAIRVACASRAWCICVSSCSPLALVLSACTIAFGTVWNVSVAVADGSVGAAGVAGAAAAAAICACSVAAEAVVP